MPLSGIGFGEMLMIAMLVLIVFGPRRLPEITRSLGKALRELKRGMNEIKRELEVADRETRWSSSGAGASTGRVGTGPAIAGPMAAGVAGTATVSEPAGESDDGTAEADGSRPEADSPMESGGPDGHGSDGSETPGTGSARTEPMEPPTPTPGYVDPADEFIDPWSTDSSSFLASRPRPSSVSGEPVTEGETEGDEAPGDSSSAARADTSED